MDKPHAVILERRTWISRSGKWIDARTGEVAPLALAARLTREHRPPDCTAPDAETLMRQGFEHLEARNYLQAQLVLQDALKDLQGERRGLACALLGEVWRRRGEPATALSVVLEDSALGHPEALACHARSLADQGHVRDAQFLLREAMTRFVGLHRHPTLRQTLRDLKSKKPRR